MPIKPKKPCKHNGCPLLTHHTYCEFHVRLHANDRPSSYERGYNSRWQTARKQFLAKNPLCKQCESQSRLTPATVVDHIEPHRGNQTSFWNQANWQPLCKKCHDRKTRTMDQYPEYHY